MDIGPGDAGGVGRHDDGPSSLANSDSRWGVNSAFEEESAVQMDRTSASSPHDQCAPIGEQHPFETSRSGRPGATSARARRRPRLFAPRTHGTGVQRERPGGADEHHDGGRRSLAVPLCRRTGPHGAPFTFIFHGEGDGHRVFHRTPRAEVRYREDHRDTRPGTMHGESRCGRPPTDVGGVGDWRISPPRPTSPKATMSAANAIRPRWRARAKTRARSAAGSVTRIPPTAEAKTSVARTPPRPARGRRAAGPGGRRRHTLGRAGAAAPTATKAGARRAWISTRRAAAPSMAGATACPGSRAASPSRELVGVGHRRRPASPMAKRPAHRWGRSGAGSPTQQAQLNGTVPRRS